MNFSLPGNRKFVGSLSYLLCLVLPMLVVHGCGKEEKPPEVIRSIRWIKVVETTTMQVRMISGTTKPVDQTALSFAVGGTVEKVEVRLGDQVKKGQVLAELDPQPFAAVPGTCQAGANSFWELEGPVSR